MTINNPESRPGTDADYAAIEAAVMETARGRWFLAEYAKRNRSADTRQVLGALERLETALMERDGERTFTAPLPAAAPDHGALGDILEQTRGRIAEIAASSDAPGRMRNEVGLAIAISCAEEALTRIRAGVEGAEAMARMVREADQPEEFCAAVDGHAQDVATAEVVQETALRILAVLVDALHRVESELTLPGIAAPTETGADASAEPRDTAPERRDATPDELRDTDPHEPRERSPAGAAFGPPSDAAMDALSIEDRQALFS